MNGTTTLPIAVKDAPIPAPRQDAGELVDRVRAALAASGQAQPAPRGWVRRVQRTSPLESRSSSR